MAVNFNHTLCEVCWFALQPDRFPVMLNRPKGDYEVDQCCKCGTVKLTRIWVRLDPREEDLACGPAHAESDD